MADVTRILKSIEGGDPAAAAGSLPLTYDELRLLAAARLARIDEVCMRFEEARQKGRETGRLHESGNRRWFRRGAADGGAPAAPDPPAVAG